MKITLIHPCIGRIPDEEYIRSWQMEPLTEAYLAGLIPDDIEVAFWDDRMEPIPFDDPTELVAISIETYTAKRAYQIASSYRARGVKVVMGGFHATLVPDEVLEYADAIVVGEAENNFPTLLDDFNKGRLKRVYNNEQRPDLSIICSDRNIFKDKKYLKLGLIEATRGCRFHCDFCAIAANFKGTHRHRPIDCLIQEIRALTKQKKLFFFVDDNIVSNINFAKAFFKALIPLKIRWVGQASITLTHDTELLELMKKSGCQGVLIGFESLNPKNLIDMNKGFNHARGGFEPALNRLNAFGIRLYATFIFGYDHDKLEDFSETVRFCMDHNIFIAAFNHLTPFPGTPLYDKLSKSGRLLYDTWWLSDSYRYGQIPFKTLIPPEEINEACFKARCEFFGIDSILKRMFSAVNSGSFFMWKTYCFINFLLRKEARQRVNYPLGDMSFNMKELIKVQNP